MHIRPNLRLSMLTTFAVSLASSGCFSPLVTELGTEGSSSGGEESGTTAETTTSSSSSGVDPDDSSGPPPAVCGDGVVEGDEVCDDGVNDGAYGGCTADCSALGPFCGDGVHNGGEDCDDGDAEDGNGCNVNCVVSGSVLWTVTYDGPDHGPDAAHGVTTDSLGDVIVSGNLGTPMGTQGWVRKYSSQGATIWTVDVTSPAGSAANGPILTLLDDDVVFGGNYATAGGDRDAWIRRYSTLGESVWTQTYSNPQNEWDSVSGLNMDESGYIYVLFEESGAPTASGYRTLVRKYTPEGSELWTQFHADDVRGRYLATDGQGHTIVGGTYYNGGASLPWIQQTNSDGLELWTRILDANGASSPSALAASETGTIVVTLSPPASASFALRLDTAGNEVDSLTLHPEAPLAYIHTAYLDGADNLLIGGSIVDSNDDVYGWISKYSPEGEELWTNTVDGPFDNGLSFDSVHAIDIDPFGDIVAAGRIHESGDLLSDIWVSKYAP